MRNKKTLLLRLAAIVLALLVWQIASMAVGTDLLLVSPLKVAKRLAELVFEKDFFPTVFYSLVRVFSGFLIAFFLGIILAVAAGRCRLLVVTGCLAQRYEKSLLQEIPEIELVAYDPKDVDKLIRFMIG